MSTETRKKEHKENLRALILEETIGIIAETGWQNLNMRMLADRINYSPRTIYLYFRNKDDLLDAVIEKAFSETIAAISSNRTSDAPPEKIFRTMINRHIRNGLQQPLLYRAVTSGISRDGYEKSNPERELNGKISRLLEQLLPEVSPGDADLRTEIFLASLRGITLMLINKMPEAGQIEKSISIYSEIILRGLLWRERE